MKSLILVVALTYGGALVSLFRPYYGLLVYISFSIIKPNDLWPWSVSGGNYSRIVGVALLAGWALAGFGDWRLGRARRAIGSLVAYTVWAAVGIFYSEDTGLATAYVEELAKIVLPILAGITLIDSVAKLKQLAWVILLSVGYIALEFNLSYYNGYNRIRYGTFGGFDNNGIAIMLNTCVWLAILLGFDAKGWWQRLLCLGSALLIINGVLMSNSRGGMLTLLVSSMIAVPLIPKRASHYLLFALIFVLGIRMAGPEARERFMTIFAEADDRDASLEGRSRLLSYAIDSIRKRPVLGVGPNQWTIVVKRDYPIKEGHATEVHNTWAQITAELGLVGLFLILSYYGSCACRLIPIALDRRADVDPDLNSLARAVVASIAGSVLACSFVTVEALEPPYYIALIGCLVVKMYNCESSRINLHQRTGRYLS
ncbi:O-antigen ligase family protein [Tautonia plasticadhaerens]|uniref:O-Antigen ligase n=1 Tax=Tautonia plasticadhaerens TaxID=2527974 RepID=A0A518HFW0_9BACT|nr:O-antigen ligase family protein [Tautonia plasticadhaerens]QDV39698.1 O-Antigen ligase [Tautonia plasticadhaerens]